MFHRVLALHPPVEAPIARPFVYAGSPFQRGLHRGIDLAAPPGTRVVAPCDGAVAYAGAHAVTLACGRYRVTLLPLRDVHARGHVTAGAPLARVAAAGAHDGLHLGVRHAADRFGYVDPARLLAHTRSVPVGPAPPPAKPRALRLQPRMAQPAPEPASAAAPPVAWAALAAAALAAAGRARVRFRRRHAPISRAAEA
jgi:hypothetical protein